MPRPNWMRMDSSRLAHWTAGSPRSWVADTAQLYLNSGSSSALMIFHLSKTQPAATRTTQALAVGGAAPALPVDLQHTAIPVGIHTHTQKLLKETIDTILWQMQIHCHTTLQLLA
ncbi:uncharacterized protein [Penaeus vannamei]|uniref:uncharacterized protein isoform X4 n=1 Tax=Penaeus vannamei TaxID=6689 RepID=UPI00387F7AAF